MFRITEPNAKLEYSMHDIPGYIRKYVTLYYHIDLFKIFFVPSTSSEILSHSDYFNDRRHAREKNES